MKYEYEYEYEYDLGAGVRVRVRVRARARKPHLDGQMVARRVGQEGGLVHRLNKERRPQVIEGLRDLRTP